MRAKVKRLRAYTIVVRENIPITLGNRDEVRLSGEECRKNIERELGRDAFKFANIKVDWYARTVAAKIKVIDCRSR